MARYSLMVTAILGFLITAAVENMMLPMLRQWQMRHIVAQPILRRNKPQIPSMGGLAVILGTIAAVTTALFGLFLLEPRLIDGHQRLILVSTIMAGFAFGCVGIWNDMRVYFREDHRPLPWRGRIAIELGIAVAFLGALQLMHSLTGGTVLPFMGYVDFSIWCVPLAAVSIVAMIESAHVCAAGLGLCSLNGFFACLACSVIAALHNHLEIALFATALSGALLAFLIWGFPPAKLLLGRSGSAFIAGSVAVIAIAMGWGGLLLLLGILYWLEGAAYVLQGLSYKLRKRPLWKDLPLQAAMEKAGWSEARIVCTMGLAAMTGMLLALLQVWTATV